MVYRTGYDDQIDEQQARIDSLMGTVRFLRIITLIITLITVLLSGALLIESTRDVERTAIECTVDTIRVLR